MDPMFIKTPAGIVSVYGHEHVSRKDLIILAHCLSITETEVVASVTKTIPVQHNVSSVVFRVDGRPVGEFAAVALDANAIVINLIHTFELSHEAMMDVEPDSSIQAIFHRNLLLSYLHEIHHTAYLGDGIPEAEAEYLEAENLAMEWSQKQLCNLAKTVDLEPEHYSRCPFLAAQITALLEGEVSDKAVQQKTMLENRTMYSLAETDEYHSVRYNFKEYLYIALGDEHEKDEWETATILQPGCENSIAANIVSLSSVGIAEAVQPAVAPAVAPVERVETVQEAPAPVVNEAHVVGGFGDPELDALDAIGPPSEEAEMVDPMYDNIVVPVDHLVENYDVPEPEVSEPVSNGFDKAEVGKIMKGVYDKIYRHIFTVCQPLTNSDVAFKYPEGVAAVPIVLTDVEKAVVVKMDCLDVQGRWNPGMSTAGGELRGFITHKQKLPAYKLYLNVGGELMVRMILPQNVNSRYQGGGLKQVSEVARAGSRIMWVMEGDDELAASKKWLLKYQDDVITVC